MKIKVILSVLLLFIPLMVLNAGQHGKLKGKVIDKQTKEGVFGANIVIDGTYLGASADVDGNFIIANIPPGEYSVTVSAISYHKAKMTKVLIKIDLTTNAEIELTPSIININQEVVVTASRPLVQKDMTSTNAIVTAADIKMMPVEEVGQIVNLQAGVVGGHFRGGRANEVSYLIDGVSVTDVYDGGVSVALENSIVRQMEVISGTFNAEYGQAMSGIVNIVTQDGSSNFEGSVSAYAGNYITNHSSIFKNLDKYSRLAQKNLQFSLSGPTGLGALTFFVNGRYYDDIGYLYGKRVYNITDDVPLVFEFGNQRVVIPRNTGDGSYVSMNPSRKFSANGKLTYSLPEIKFSYGVFWDDNKNKYYDHGYSWTPDGKMTHYRTNTIHNFQVSHYPTANTYQALKFAYDEFNYKGYLYEDEFDPRYINPTQGTALTNYTFRSGGNEGGRYQRTTTTFIAQYSLSSQINENHKIGFGAEFKKHDLSSHDWDLVNLTDGQIDSLENPIWTPGYPNEGSITDNGRNIRMAKSPVEASVYIQDKMEYDIMIINAGLRMDYFDAKAGQPLDQRNPRNNSDFPGYSPNGVLLKMASAKYQLSPR
ncbi:MAG: TonB-dependent receptor, partial [Ignavibacteriales bacterium]|nr:TonB-dependent receptor [Ignavibacteriales bacterium]